MENREIHEERVSSIFKTKGVSPLIALVKDVLEDFFTSIDKNTKSLKHVSEDSVEILIKSYPNMTINDFEDALNYYRRNADVSKYDTATSIVKKALIKFFEKPQEKESLSKQEWLNKQFEIGEKVFNTYMPYFMSNKIDFACNIEQVESLNLGIDYNKEAFNLFVEFFQERNDQFISWFQKVKSNTNIKEVVLKRINREYQTFYKKSFAWGKPSNQWDKNEVGYYRYILSIYGIYFFLQSSNK